MKRLKPYIQTLPGDTETPITLYQKLVGDGPGMLLESCEHPKGRYSFMASGPEAIIRSKGEDILIERKGRVQFKRGKVLEAARDFMKAYQVVNDSEIPFVGGLVGSVGYDVIRQYETLPDSSRDLLEIPDAYLMAVTQVVAYDHFHHAINLVVLEEAGEEGERRAKEQLKHLRAAIQKPFIPPAVEKTITVNQGKSPVSNMSMDDYMQKVIRAKEYIHEGDIFQVVLSQRWCMETQEKPFELYRKLRQVNPSAYMFYINFGDFQLAGSSPEMLVEVRKNQVRTCPMAGTKPRGIDKAADDALARELLADEKERAEHVMLVDLGRNDMGRVAKVGSVKVSDFMTVKYYSHVMHLVSLVEGEKRNETDMFEVLSAFLPAGTLSGAPKIRAMEIIEELEPVKRGLYGGATGYFGFDGDMDMCISIRTMILLDGHVYLQAGAGIVADSVPEKEYEETLNKVRALTKALEEDVAI